MSLLPVGLAALAGGAALILWARRARVRARRDELADRLDLAAERVQESEDEPDETPNRVVEGAVGLISQAVQRVDRRGSLGGALLRARIPLRPGEYVLVTVAASLVLAALTFALTRKPVVAILFAALGPAAAVLVVRRGIAKRRKAFEAQLPGALSLVASSLSAGHTFLRAIHMMCDESDPPLGEEFARVVGETQLGDSLVDALARMADRLQIRDLDWVVQAIRIQQTVGGRLADLLHTLADFIRARDEVRREVLVLTAEGRISAYVLGAMAPLLIIAIQVMNPKYIQPMYHGMGLIVLLACGASVVIGTVVILRMAKVEV